MTSKAKAQTRTRSSRKRKPKPKKTLRSGDVYVKGFYRHRTPRRKKKAAPPPIIPPTTPTTPAPAANNTQPTDTTDSTKNGKDTDNKTAADTTKDAKTKDKKKGTGKYKFVIFLLLVAIGLGVYFSIGQNPPTDQGGVGGGVPDFITKGASDGKAKDGTIVVGVSFFVIAFLLSIYRLFTKDYGSPAELENKVAQKLGDLEVDPEPEISGLKQMAAGHGAKAEHVGPVKNVTSKFKNLKNLVPGKKT